MCPCRIVESYLPYRVARSQATQQYPPLQVQESDLRTLRRGWKWLQLFYPAVQATSQSEELQLSKQEFIPQPFGVYLERKMALQRLGERCDSLHPSVFRGMEWACNLRAHDPIQCFSPGKGCALFLVCFSLVDIGWFKPRIKNHPGRQQRERPVWPQRRSYSRKTITRIWN